MATARGITTIGFDADDTLWHNEAVFQLTEERFRALLEPHAAAAAVSERLLETERRNLGHYGFGVKGFVLSMIETALDLSGDRLDAGVIRSILAMGQEMLLHPVETLPGARSILEALRGHYQLVLVTKGDLFDQERKLAASGLGEFFDAVEIVSDKTPDTYCRVFSRHGEGPAHAMMVGNSMRSDILPALEAGAVAVHVPHDLVWEHERAEPPQGPLADRFFVIDRLESLVPVLAQFG